MVEGERRWRTRFVEGSPPSCVTVGTSEILGCRTTAGLKWEEE